MSRAFHTVANLFPLMDGQEFDALVADIREHGLREPIWLHQDERIIDGRNRYRACVEAGVNPAFQSYIGPDDSLTAFVVSMNLQRRHLNESQRALVGARMANLEKGQRADRVDGSIDLSTAGQMLSVSGPSIKRAKTVLQSESPHLVVAIDSGEVTVSDAAAVSSETEDEQLALLQLVSTGKAKNLQGARRQRNLKRQRDEIALGHVARAEGRFDVIAIDPPWKYPGSYHTDHWLSRVAIPYPPMAFDELAALELPAAENCVLWLWTTNRFMPDACALEKAWGFEHKTILTWDKERIGVGQWLRGQTEHVLMVTGGSPPRDPSPPSTLIRAPAREHSRKPDEFYQLVNSVCVGRKLDCFSREKRPGWEQFGNDAAKFGDVA